MIEISMVISLFLMILIFQSLRAIDLEATETETPEIQIEVADIPPTEQIKKPPPPPKPSVPIPTESEDVPEDLTIESTDLDLSDIPEPPPPPPEDDGNVNIFVAYDEEPRPIGGFRAIQRALKYPEIARKAGIEGKVIVHVLVNKQGEVENTRILKSLGHSGCDDAAINAIKSVKWKPALQRDKPVKVWVAIPVIFKLK
ncbi:energy transducer TonB [candidate division KSB1 bacterium]|nr:energy transducer TonB [candidate division KSB1 bacterium]NIR71027.1 energy transducer TonB [candidate division KSB1 bacterium]NIS26112.1 energy transducer TonB [candidate division KSB1 bacterium]NIT72906.1 energy transducer TonB [candidate division KSB1 bacterium]NIU26751.1 energy transducer TonB [candidate division KSB1 bacterium]